MYKLPQAIEYNSQYGIWDFNLPKAHKDIHSQAGLKITIPDYFRFALVNQGIPTGDTGPIYDSKYRAGLVGSTITFKGYDNISGWSSHVTFSLPSLLEALIKLVPKEAIDAKTFILALNDLKKKEEEDEI